MTDERARIAALVVIFVVCVSAACFSMWVGRYGTDEPESTWPSTAEFRQLHTGQDRFSEHATNISDTYVLVDHETGVCYVCTPDGVAVMVDDEGEPVREKEAA